MKLFEIEIKDFRCFAYLKCRFSSGVNVLISNLEGGDDSSILRMAENKQPTIIDNVYGLDYNSSVEDIMGVDARNAEIDNLLNSLAFFEQGS